MTPLSVHQTLHGYNDGHRLISGSVSLQSGDARAMLVMSDLSGPGVKPTTDGYLTGYPLEESGQYVLARTWAAPEMPRPGCVWTHSLIIPNADLAKMTSAAGLLEAFSRPVGLGAKAQYSTAVSIDRSAVTPFAPILSRVRTLIDALYSVPDRKIVAEAMPDAGGDDERLLTAIWMQQWPRLRRTFGFCTLAGMDRSAKGVPLDLQLAQERGPHLSAKFPNAFVATGDALSAALEPLVADLLATDGSNLREFLKRTGGDVDGGRRAMIPLCNLYVSLLGQSPPNLSGAVRALGLLDGDGKPQARSVRTLVARQARKSAEQIDDEVFDFLVEALEQSSDEADRVELGDQLGIALWRRSPRRFFIALEDGGALGYAAAHALDDLHADEILAGLKGHGEIAASLASRRPKLLKEADFWRIPEVDDAVADLIPNDLEVPAARALLAAGRARPAMKLIPRLAIGDLAPIIEASDAFTPAAYAWIEVLCRDRNRIAAVLASGTVKRMSTLRAIASFSQPDDVPNAYGDDPWLIGLRSASGTLSRTDQDFLAAYLIARALGRESRSQAELMQFSYTQVYKAFQERRFSSDAARFARGRLGYGFWLDWDDCSRLRETVVGRFVDFDLDPAVFGRLTDDGVLAGSLIDEAARSGRGRKYLDRVRRTLKHANEKALRVRADYIAQKLK